ncbi:MAG TPA: dynamin family protein [Roseiflexaceae bacterium]|nr:dynamin family protein [Roseiflexaceae bacterium]HMP41542.1 dynamin family protein [Roseiflexaceae bacterium]
MTHPTRRLTSERHLVLLERQRGLLTALHAALDRFGTDVAPADLQTLGETLANLDELFLLVIAGEFNSGKSSVINALLGERLLAEGVTPTTDRITLVRHGTEACETPLAEFLVERRIPADVLRSLVIVDTPGTNAVIRHHETLTHEFLPRADLVLFVTSADRPFTESERAFLEVIREWGKKIVIVLNKIDLLAPAELDEVMSFISDHAHAMFGSPPVIFPVSARLAQRAQQGDTALANVSRFGTLDTFVRETLDEQERVRLKLRARLGVAQRLTTKYLTAVEERLAVLQQDRSTIENIEQQIDLFRDDLDADFAYHQAAVEQVLADFELRAMRFFDETIRVTNIPHLVRGSDSIRQTFEADVVADVPQLIEQRIQALIDWMVEKNLRLWHATTDYLRREQAPQHRSGMIGDIGGSFEYNRNALIDSVARRAHEVIASYDREAESHALNEEIRAALAGSALVGAGAVGIGALLVAVLHTAAFDITGVLAAGVIAISGLYIIPNKRRQLKQQFHQRIAGLREQLLQTMRRQFEIERNQIISRIHEAIAPYTRFIRAQHTRLLEVQRDLSDIDVETGRLRAELGGE